MQHPAWKLVRVHLPGSDQLSPPPHTILLDSVHNIVLTTAKKVLPKKDAPIATATQKSQNKMQKRFPLQVTGVSYV